MITIALCDDNELFLSQLKEMVGSLVNDNFKVISFLGSEELLNYLNKYSFNDIDIIITDIEMPKLNGIDTAKFIRAKNPKTQVIFATAYMDYAEKIFETEPVYFIVKPFTKEKVENALNKALNRLEIYEGKCIDLTVKSKVLRIPYGDIKYVESRKRNIYIHKIKEDIELCMKLDDFEKKAPNIFLRIHKSYLVNMNMIKSISNNKIELLSGEEIPVAKTKFTDIKEEILNFLGDTI